MSLRSVRFLVHLLLLLVLVGSSRAQSEDFPSADCAAYPSLSAPLLPFWDKHYGFLDRSGAVAIPPRYESVQLFCEGVALVALDEDPPVRGLDEHGAELFRLPSSWFMDHKSMGSSCFSDGLNAMWVWHPNGRDAKCGYIDHTGSFVIAPKYDLCFRFHHGLAVVQPEERDTSILINKEGKELATYPEISLCVGNGRVAAKSGSGADADKWGFLDTSGAVAIPFQYEGVSHFSDGLAVVTRGGKLGYSDPEGKLVIPLQFDRALAFSQGRAVVAVGGKYGFVDSGGKYIVEPQYQDALPFSDGLAAVKLQDVWGYIGLDGRPRIAPRYVSARPFHEGRAAVMKRIVRDGTTLELWGVIAADEVQVAPFSFDYVGPFDGGIAPMSLQGRYGYLSKDGKIVWREPVGAPD